MIAILNLIIIILFVVHVILSYLAVESSSCFYLVATCWERDSCITIGSKDTYFRVGMFTFLSTWLFAAVDLERESFVLIPT